MQSQLNPYISFRNNAREAMDFYKSIFGGKLTLTTFKEGKMPGINPNEENLVMHSVLEAENGISFMGADTPESIELHPGASISMALSGDNEEELTNYFNKLSEGGTVHEPLAKAPWGDSFGMVADKFGVEWMVNITAKKDQV
jgi:PhnB protein